jgi:ATP-binding cassette subfamily F protein uup
VAKKKLSYKEQREFDALPDRITALESEQATLQSELNGGQLYNSDPARATQLGARLADIEQEWLKAMERWETLGGS